MTKKRQTKKQRSKLFYLLAIGCFSVFIYAAYGLVSTLFDYYNNRVVLASLQDIYYEDSAEEEVVSLGAEKRVRAGFEGLKELNEDIVGWLTIDNTKIDYPILQGENNTKYLDRNYHGDYSRAGSIFMDYRNNVTLNENNFILYGHRVKDGSMFQQLTNYLDEDFYRSNQKFTFDTLYDRYEAEIFAVYNTMIDFNYIETDFQEEEKYEQLLKDIHDRSIYDSELDVQPTDQIITLSTCEYTLDADDSRLVIHAKLTKIE